MDKREIIVKTKEYVKKTLQGEATGHDWWHIYRVWNNAKNIAKTEKRVDHFVVELSALLHDISDWKFNDGDEKVGAEIAKTWLNKLNVDKPTIQHVYDIVASISFKGAGVKSEIKTLEGKVVQDADRLDAIGAVGIGRAFAYGGYKNREMYDPNQKPGVELTADQYKNNNSPTINHFYEKLLLLKDLMNTKSAKKIAEGRHSYMAGFLDRFYDEWAGKL